MKIVADENIPLLDYYFGDAGELVVKPGRMIVHQDLVDADILLVRSVTHVNQALLENTAVKFVGSPTAGYDHLDIDWLEKNNIKWAVASGCNSEAVAEYVVCAIAALQKMEYLIQKKCRAGVIGVGNIGKRVVELLKILNFDVVQCDPLRAEKENDFEHTPIEAFEDLDFITIHTPLTKEGKYPTYHLIGKEFLARQKKESVIMNVSRGAVVNFAELKSHGQYLNWCLDVWEHEPKIDIEILGASILATPHIAGYSIQAKCRGTEMIYRAARNLEVLPAIQKTEVSFPHNRISFNNARVDWREVILKIYDPTQTSQWMKNELLSHHDTYDHLRKHFPDRHEFAYTQIRDVQLFTEDKNILTGLGINPAESILCVF